VTAVVTSTRNGSASAATQPEAGPPRPSRWSRALSLDLLPGSLAVVYGIAFLIVRPDVNDLWAARARASAAAHGVGLTYWFAWFGGGATPGNYSVLTPYLSALVSAEVVGAVSAVAVTIGCQVLVRGTQHARAAALLGALVAGINLWSGRIPFLLGGAFAIGALIAVRSRRTWIAAALAVLTVTASPVPAAFLALGLAALAFVDVSYRRVCLIVGGISMGALLLVAITFGTPGPEPFSFALLVETVLWLAVMLVAKPAPAVRVAVVLAIVSALAIFLVPNGMGSNLSRVAWFCLPVAVVATSRLRTWLAILVVAASVAAGASRTVSDLSQARQPMASAAYYLPLAEELDGLTTLSNYRVEVVTNSAHAAYDALLGHAMLARGWETQEDTALNKPLVDPTLNAISYRVWLENNAVGFVALPRTSGEHYPEYKLVSAGKLPFLTEIWQSPDWRLFKVSHPSPVVGTPAHLVKHTQSRLTLTVPCACQFNVRVRYSRFLHAFVPPPAGAAKNATPTEAEVEDDGTGWTLITTDVAGTYFLQGSITKLFG